MQRSESYEAEGKKAVYKIHGSTKNIITGEDTRKSLITTIAALNRVPKSRWQPPLIVTEYDGIAPYEEDRKGSEFENLFQLERHKRPLFKNITENRSLVVIGYSGSDDFDIVPTLKMLKNLQNVIWLKYKHDNDGTAQIHEITAKDQGSNKIDEMLIDLKERNVADHVYRVEVNTSRLIPNLLDSKPTLSHENFTITPAEWLQNNVEEPNELVKFLIPANIYEELEKYPDALRCSQEMYRIYYPFGTDSPRLKREKALILRRIGEIHYRLENYTKALDMFNFAIKLMRLLRWPDDQGLDAPIYNWLGKTYIKLGDLRKASECLSEAHSHNWASERGRMSFSNPIYLASTRENMGIVNFKKKKYKKAINFLEEALDLYEAIGDPEGKFSVFYHLGMVYYAKDDFSEALRWFVSALKLAYLLELQDSREAQDMKKYIQKIKGQKV